MINKIAICGVGRLGLPLALNFERSGINVIGYDVNAPYVESLNARDFVTDEPDVSRLLASSSIHFCTDTAAVIDAEFAVICVRTDSQASGAYELEQLWNFISSITDALSCANVIKLRAIAINCNVNPGTTRVISEILRPFGIETYFWPEWVKQGSVIHDQTHPAVTVLGQELGYQTLNEVLQIISRLNNSSEPVPVRLLGLIEAELCKVSLNCYLTMKISFANMVSNLSEEIGLDVAPILEALSHDPRIGGAFLKPGFGYGGPCLPRDNAALINFAQGFGIPMPLCEAADAVNLQRHQTLVKHAVRDFHKNGKLPEIETLSYKKGIAIYTESQPLKFANQVVSIGIPIELQDECDRELAKDLLVHGNRFLRHRK